MRLFFGIPLAGAAMDAARAAQAQAKASAAARLGWTKPEQLHFTLAFLGEADQQLAQEAGREAAKAVGPFEMSLGGIGAFPNPRRPRVIWLGASDGAQQMAALAEALRAALRTRGLPFDEKPFHAHATLARVRPPEQRAAARLLESLPAAPSAGQRVEAFVLFDSKLGGSRGSEHVAVERFALGSG